MACRVIWRLLHMLYVQPARVINKGNKKKEMRIKNSLKTKLCLGIMVDERIHCAIIIIIISLRGLGVVRSGAVDSILLNT